MKIIEYFKDVKSELVHVSFPSRKITMLYTVFVALLSIGVALFLGLFDFIFKMGIEKII